MLVTVINKEEDGNDEESPSDVENNVESYSNPAYSIDFNQEYQSPRLTQEI